MRRRAAAPADAGLSQALLRFAVPLILSGLLQQLYSMVDALIIGNVMGEAALAATAASGPVLNVFIFVINGLVTGCTILVSHAWGAGDRARTGRITATFAAFVGAVGVAVCLLGLGLHRPLLRVMNIPAVLMEDAAGYLGVVLLGIPFLAIYNLAGAVLRGVGNSRTPLVAIVISSIVNVGLDLLFVAGFGWGVRGAAVATAIAQVLSALYLTYYLLSGRGGFTASLRRGQMDGGILREGLTLSLPKVVQSSVNSAGSLMLQNVMNSFGVDVIAAVTTAYRIDMMAILPIMNLSTAVSVFAGQGFGAGEPQRAQASLRHGLRITTLCALAITAVFVLFGRQLISLFGVSPHIADMGQRFFYFLGAFYPVLAIGEACSGFLQGAKDVRFVTVAGIATFWVRVLLSYLLRPVLGSDVIAVAEIACWSLSAVLLVARYRSGRWRRHVAGLAEG